MAELFRSKVNFYGKHGQYLDALTPDTQKLNNEDLPEIQRKKFLFEKVVDIYAMAPLVGYFYQRKGERDGSTQTKTIMENAISNNRDQLLFSYELLMLLDKSSEPDLNERIRRAFCATDELSESGFKVYNAYALGGIEVLYEKLIEDASSPEDLVRNLMDFVADYNDKFNEAVDELDIESLVK